MTREKPASSSTDDLLKICSQEPIHIPGSIQAYGFMIVVQASDNKVVQVSDNIKSFLGRKVDQVLHQSVFDLPISNMKEIISLVKATEGGYDCFNPVQVVITSQKVEKNYNLIICGWRDYFMLEFEPAQSPHTLLQYHTVTATIVDIISGKSDLNNSLAQVTRSIRELIGYDRVMIYKFHDDWHGEVIAESHKNGHEPYLHLHYPASDIPSQARELYVKNIVRLIADVHQPPSVLCPAQIDDLEWPTDLTHCVLRAVSPVHIEYLKNMKVSASFSISLIVNNKLWGLIACHHQAAKTISYEVRQTCKIISQILSAYIQRLSVEENTNYRRHLFYLENSFMHDLNESKDLLGALETNKNYLQKIVPSIGYVGCIQGKTFQGGKIGPESKKIIKWILENAKSDMFYTHQFATVAGWGEEYSNRSAGVLALILNRQKDEYLVWFRPEYMQTVNWAGNPLHKVEVQENKKISPRKSFESWSEEVRHASIPWREAELAVALKLRDDLVDYGSKKDANDAHSLSAQIMNEFGYTVSHDLKTPLNAIMFYSELLSEELGQNFSDEAKDYVVRIMGNVKRMNGMLHQILLYTRSGSDEIEKKEVKVVEFINDMIRDIVVVSPVAVKVHLGDLPYLYGDQMMIFQVFQNIISNAVKFSSKSVQPTVFVHGFRDEVFTTYCITDTGIGIESSQAERVFRVFGRLQSERDFEGHGVGLAIVKRIIDRHKGKIWFESEPGRGTKFYFSFPNPGLA